MAKHWSHFKRARQWVLDDWSPELESSGKKGGGSIVKCRLNSRL